jgi:DNA polymerase delta subunit 1
MIEFGGDDMVEAARLGIASAKAITEKINRKPIKLECEKGMWPFLLLEPKRYVYKEYDVEHPEAPAKYKKGPKTGQDIIKAKGVGSERRDNTLFEVNVQRNIQNALMDNDPDKAVAIAEDAIHRLITGKVNPFEMVLSAQWAKRKEDYSVIPTVVHLAERMAARDPGSAPQVGDRIPYVLVETGLKKSQERVRDMAEDPEYAISKKLPLHKAQYLKRIDHPIRQLLERVVSKQRLHEVFHGPHTRFIVKQAQARGIGLFGTYTRPCIGCKANISAGGGNRAVCDQCKESGVAAQLFEEQEIKSKRKREECDKVWSYCAKECKNVNTIEEMEQCSSKGCPRHSLRLALRLAAETEEETTKRFRSQLDLF